MKAISFSELRDNFHKPAENDLLRQISKLNDLRTRIENGEPYYSQVSSVARQIMEYADYLSAYCQIEYDMERSDVIENAQDSGIHTRGGHGEAKEDKGEDRQEHRRDT